MRVVLVGPAAERERVRAELNGTFQRGPRAIEIVGEFPTLAAARAARVEVDAVILTDAGTDIGTGSAPAGAAELVDEPLTAREIQVLELLAEGLPNKAIAARLDISDQTVKFHVASISGKLGAANRTDVVRRAVRRGLIAL